MDQDFGQICIIVQILANSSGEPESGELFCTIMQNFALGEAVRRRRQELGLRQADLADLAGCSARFLHELEHDKPRMALDLVMDVLEALGLTLAVINLSEPSAAAAPQPHPTR